MNIDIYSKYKVIWCNSGAEISQEDSEPNDIVFNHYENDTTIIIDGAKLLNDIQRLLNDAYIQEFAVIDNTIRIELFNYNNGESDSYIITVERIESEVNLL